MGWNTSKHEKLFCSIDNEGRLYFDEEAKKHLKTRVYVKLVPNKKKRRIGIIFLQRTPTTSMKKREDEGIYTINWKASRHLELQQEKFNFAGIVTRTGVPVKRFELRRSRTRGSWYIEFDKPLRTPISRE